MINTKSEFQIALNQAHRYGRTMSKSDLGPTDYDHWTTLSNVILASAYDVWADNHDQAGRTAQVVDPAIAKSHVDALFASLQAMTATVGEVSFSDDNSAKLDVNKSLADLVVGMSFQTAKDYSQEVRDLIDQIDDCKYDLKLAKEDFARYNFNGSNEEAKAKKAEAVETLQLKMEGLRKAKSEALKKIDAKPDVFVANDEGKFRSKLENIIFDMITDQNAMTYEAYRAKKEAQRKARREKTAQRKAQKQATK